MDIKTLVKYNLNDIRELHVAFDSQETIQEASGMVTFARFLLVWQADRRAVWKAFFGLPAIAKWEPWSPWKMGSARFPQIHPFFSRSLPKMAPHTHILTPWGDPLYPGKRGLSRREKDQCWTGLLSFFYTLMDEGRVCGISFAGPNLTYSEIDLRFSILICLIYCDLVRLKLSSPYV